MPSLTPIGPLVGAIDEGTSSARFILFKVGSSEVVTFHQISLDQQTPQEGWVEQDAMQIMSVVNICIEETIKKLEKLGGSVKDIVAIGITNQRETTVVWDKHTGKPLYNAILWLDTRTTSTIEKLMKTVPHNANENFLKPICGLRLATYFSAVKLHWLIDHVTEVKKAVEEDRCLFGTIDTWLLWNLTGKHITDVTNASRTMLMNIKTLEWDQRLLKFFELPLSMLPDIKSSSEIYGEVKDGPLKGVRISGCLGDQQAALVGQQCMSPGEAKATYGTGCFILYNTGTTPHQNSEGLITTVAYQLGSESPPHYALEGSVAVAGLAFEWLKQNIGMLENVADAQSMIERAPDTGAVTFVPAFSGLFAPYWQSDARGVICGITDDTEAHHFVRAALEAICFQVKDVVDVMSDQCGLVVQSLKVDGGMTANELLLQTQADLGGFDVVKAGLSQSTALGAAMVAQWGVGVVEPGLTFIMKEGQRFSPKMELSQRNYRYDEWKKALERSFGWSIAKEDSAVI